MNNLAVETWQVTQLDGSPAPDLEAYRGKYVLLLFFNLGCLGCMNRGVPLANDFAKHYPDLQVIGIHSNFGLRSYEQERIESELAPFDLRYPVLMDEGHTTYDGFKAEGTPHWVLLDTEGNIAKSIFGSQPNAQQRLTYGMLELFGY